MSCPMVNHQLYKLISLHPRARIRPTASRWQRLVGEFIFAKLRWLLRCSRAGYWSWDSACALLRCSSGSCGHERGLLLLGDDAAPHQIEVRLEDVDLLRREHAEF